MASNLSSIGFVFESADFARRLMGELAGYAVHRTATLPGDYAIWRGGSGAEIWFHVVGERSFFGRMDGGRVVGLQPFFAGEGRLPLRVLQRLKDPDHSAFEGLFVAEAEGQFVLAFNAMDYALHDMRTLPLAVNVQLVGFAREMRLFADEPALHKAYGANEVPLRSYVGDRRIGFGAADNDNVSTAQGDSPADAAAPFLPGTLAFLRGVVETYALRENEVTDRAYHWLLVDGPGGTFDVVADIEVPESRIEPGMIVEVVASFSGRLLD